MPLRLCQRLLKILIAKLLRKDAEAFRAEQLTECGSSLDFQL